MGDCISKKEVASSPSLFGRGALTVTDQIMTKYDKNMNGTLEANELHALLMDCFPKDHISPDEANTILKGVDLNQDGTVGLNELRAFLRHFNPETGKLKRKTALCIIDVQNDFISGTLANPYKGEEIVPIINGLRDKFDCVVISYDWHPQDHCSFVEAANDGKVAIKDPKEKYDAFEQVTLVADADRPEHAQMLYPRHAVQDSEGGACHKDLVVKDSDLKIYKGTKVNIDSYSAFFDNLKANDTGLTAMLEKEGVTDVYCCGLVFDICVKSTALHGAEQGFNTFVIEDASKPLSMDNMEPVKKELAEAGIEVISSEDAAATLAAAAGETAIRDYMLSIKKSKQAMRIASSQDLSSHRANA